MLISSANNRQGEHYEYYQATYQYQNNESRSINVFPFFFNLRHNRIYPSTKCLKWLVNIFRHLCHLICVQRYDLWQLCRNVRRCSTGGALTPFHRRWMEPRFAGRLKEERPHPPAYECPIATLKFHGTRYQLSSHLSSSPRWLVQVQEMPQREESWSQQWNQVQTRQKYSRCVGVSELSQNKSILGNEASPFIFWIGFRTNYRNICRGSERNGEARDNTDKTPLLWTLHTVASYNSYDYY